MVIISISSLIAGLVFAFVSGWLMTLVVLGAIPVLILCGIFYLKIVQSK